MYIYILYIDRYCDFLQKISIKINVATDVGNKNKRKQTMKLE